MRLQEMRFILQHRQTFRQLEKQIYGRNTLRGYLHDMDKLVLCMIVGEKYASKLHEAISRHHINRRHKQYEDYIQMIINWESYQYNHISSKNAYHILIEDYPYLTTKILPILYDMQLVHIPTTILRLNTNHETILVHYCNGKKHAQQILPYLTTYGNIIIQFPSYVTTISTSYCQGFIEAINQRLGYQGFFERCAINAQCDIVRQFKRLQREEVIDYVGTCFK